MAVTAPSRGASPGREQDRAESLPIVRQDVVAPAVPTVVMKFGGTSVADPDRIKAVARRLVAAHREGTRVVGVLSAMGDTTDHLLELARDVSPRPSARELDALLSVGESMACPLAAMAIADLGCEAVSLNGSQAGIVTDAFHGNAKIVDIRTQRIRELLESGAVVLVAGFQGVCGDEVTTLGRGGSDTTAVALAASLHAGCCEIYTDVDGVFSADPRVVPAARKLDAVSYEEMLEMAASGAKVVQERAVEIACAYRVRLHVRCSFTAADGTWVTEEHERMRGPELICAVTHAVSAPLVQVEGVPVGQLCAALADVHASVDAIASAGSTIVFSVPAADRSQARVACERLGARWSWRAAVGRVSVIGAGMRHHAGIAARAFGALAALGIESDVVTTSPIRITWYVPGDAAERAAAALHREFGLGRWSSSRARLADEEDPRRVRAARA